MESSVIPLIRCHGRCRKEKPPVLFWASDVKAFLKARSESRTYRPVCRQCRMDRANRTGLYSPADFTPIPPPRRAVGWVFRQDAFSLCPGSAAAAEEFLMKKGA